MYYLLAFKLLRRKQGGHNVSQHTTRLDTEFIGFSDFLKNLSQDKKIAVRRGSVGRESGQSIFFRGGYILGSKYVRVGTRW
jgi:hypothetical protein